MANKRHKPEEIVTKLRQVEVLRGQGMAMADAVRQIGVSELTYYRWRKQYGGMRRERIDMEDEEDERKKRGSYRRHKRPDLSMRQARALLTNDHCALPGDVDMRARWARRFRDLITIHHDELGGEK